jgi:hypothetical protein
MIFFGVVVGMAHTAIKLGWNINFILGVIEDGGGEVIFFSNPWYQQL